MSRSNTTHRAKKGHILIIEDSSGVARALNRTLSLPQGGGHWVEIRDSGEAALERLRGAHFDLLITDLRLPGMNGLAVLEHARQISPDTRSILITAFGSPLVEGRAQHLANAYLPKPFHLHDLIQVVHRVLSEPVAHKQPFLASSAARHRTTAKTTVVDRRKATYLKALACDLDSLLTETGQVALDTWQMLHQVRSDAAGLTVILVTGHTLESYAANVPDTDEDAKTKTMLCDAVVAENGSIVHFPQDDKTIETPKGTGLRHALQELGHSPHNVVAWSHTENSRSLFEMSELAVTTTNAPPDVQALADVVLPPADIAGLQTLIADLRAGHIPDYAPRPNRRLLLGHRTSGTPVYVDPFALVNSNVGIFGANDSDNIGKHGNTSWLASSLAEKLSKQGYQIFIIDLKGNHRSLWTDPHSHLLGGPKTLLPPATDVIEFCRNNQTNLVLDLSTHAVADRTAYLQELLPGIQTLRARFGRPHWCLIEEAHSLCQPKDGQLTHSLLNSLQTGGFSLVSDRPDQIDPTILKALDCWLVTRLSQAEEIAALRPFLTQHAGGPAALSQLPSLSADQMYVYLGDVEQPSLSTKGFIKLCTRL
jgi:CheY-like chemotaxis protein